MLEKLAELSADDVEMFARLTELTAEAEDWEATRKHRPPLAGGQSACSQRRIAAAAAAAEALGDDALAIDSYRALLLLDPFDPAEMHLQAGNRLAAAGRPASGQAARTAWPSKKRRAFARPTAVARNRRRQMEQNAKPRNEPVPPDGNRRAEAPPTKSLHPTATPTESQP